MSQIRGGFHKIALVLCIPMENMLFHQISRDFLYFSKSYVALDKSFCIKHANT
jgi:hypothetical protein